MGGTFLGLAQDGHAATEQLAKIAALQQCVDTYMLGVAFISGQSTTLKGHWDEEMFAPEPKQFAVKTTDLQRNGAPRQKAQVRVVSLPEAALKRVFDILSVFVILGLFWWAMIIVCIGIRLSGPGPLVFGHRRIGRGGKSFKCYKFRSMVPNSQEVLSELLAKDPKAREEWARDFKLKDDPRITKIGRFIRKTSLDELPQLWNVFVGEMSIVGPRPVVRKELALYYGAGRRHYLSAKPGLTGLWQVSGRNDMDYAERVELDKQYVQNWNVFGDFMIVMRTVGVMFAKKGAY